MEKSKRVRAVDPQHLLVMPGLVPGIRVLLFSVARRGWPGHLRERARKTRFALLPGHDDWET
jgi:hypothetical protein